MTIPLCIVVLCDKKNVELSTKAALSNVYKRRPFPMACYIYKCKKLQFIHTVNGDGSKTAKIIKRQC